MYKAQYGKPLDEEVFETWLEKGRSSNIGYHYLLVIWNTADEEYRPTFVEKRDEIKGYQNHVGSQDILVAIYDLYSESRISIDN